MTKLFLLPLLFILFGLQSCGEKIEKTDFYKDYYCKNNLCVISNCPSGKRLNANQTACVTFPEYGTDLKSCKALNYSDNAKTELSLTDQN